VRTIIDLPREQVEALDDQCRREGISRAEAVRRAVADHLRKYSQTAARSAFGLWRGRRLDGLKYQEALRREWRW
jgi:metal-responsive CopG/Arc/MetJ family transcriptional regulator